jgi:hypothetical protein
MEKVAMKSTVVDVLLPDGHIFSVLVTPSLSEKHQRRLRRVLACQALNARSVLEALAEVVPGRRYRTWWTCPLDHCKQGGECEAA